ncbi:hypothetical protein ACFQL1_06700 [Halomicroarcula sp. GCM10025709]|uniref:hypothetical protein n=1 Tax=Haloarcula TaxID=2237 RepID=UPI0024C2B055|nr:hypothetical protein [Halomicroarcula sp. YJ-61-S]
MLLDGEVLDETAGTNTPTLSYSNLTANSDQYRNLTLEATVSVALEETDEARNESATSTRHEETLTVRQTTRVRVYELTVSGFETEYPDGDLGLVTYKSYPWYGLSLPDGDVRGVWRFYSARTPSWDSLTTYRAGGSNMTHSPVHPLQVHAYPIETGPTPWPRVTTSLLEVYGEAYDAPALPEAVALDAIEGGYTGSFGIATRVETTNHDLHQIRAIGLVRGTSLPLNPEQFEAIPLTESNLTLAVVGRTDETITVHAHLSDAATGAPIETAAREGHLLIAGERVNTNESGVASVTVSRSQDAVSARYVPGDWWRNIPGYTGDTAVVHTGGTVLQYVDALFWGFVPIGVLLFGGYLISRVTSWNFWPPWRGL